MGTATYDFTNETVIVTGASSGIGRAIALRFAECGAVVINADIREEPKDVDAEVPTHECIREAGGTAEFISTDVSEPTEVESVVEAAREFGGVDVMINNAGTLYQGSFLESPPGAFDQLHGVNARGVFVGTQAAAGDMLDREEPGCVINTASVSANLAQHDLSVYQSTKGAVRMITRGAALELAEYDIRVNAVAPGAIATEFTDGLTADTIEGAKAGDFIKPIPMQAAGYPEDVAGAAVWLACDDARYVTGELLHVDGGYQIV